MKLEQLVESVPATMGVAGKHYVEYPKVDFKEVPLMSRMGRKIGGKYIMGQFVASGTLFDILNVTAYDYTWAKNEGLKLKADEILARQETSMTVRSGNMFTHAPIIKINLKTKTVTHIKDHESDTPVWDKTTKVSKIMILLPFQKTI